jgi:hypothetical protein
VGCSCPIRRSLTVWQIQPASLPRDWEGSSRLGQNPIRRWAAAVWCPFPSLGAHESCTGNDGTLPTASCGLLSNQIGAGTAADRTPFGPGCKCNVLSWKIGIREIRGDRMKMEAPIKELDAVSKREKLDVCSARRPLASAPDCRKR